MRRRKFLRVAVAGAIGATVTRSSMSGALAAARWRCDAGSRESSDLTAREVHEYLLRLGTDWVDRAKTVDTLIAGDPDTRVKGIAVGWMSYFWALREAVEIACNVFITHEPTFYDHRDADPSVFELAAARKKRTFIERHRLVILRCHDVWDRMAGLGITDSWAEFLGLTRLVDRSTFCRVYRVEKTRALDFARYVAECVSQLGEQSVQLVGPGDKWVRRVAIGTGAITPFRHMVRDLGADLCICTDDGFSFWRDGSLAIDMGVPVVVVNHACSEEFGMKQLANHLIEAFPDVPVHHIPQRCMFRTILG